MVYDTTPVRVELPAQGQGVGPGDETETGEPSTRPSDPAPKRRTRWPWNSSSGADFPQAFTHVGLVNTAHNLAAPDTSACPAHHRRTGY